MIPSASCAGSIKIWDACLQSCIYILKYASDLAGVIAFSPDDSKLVIGLDGSTFSVLNIALEKCINLLLEVFCDGTGLSNRCPHVIACFAQKFLFAMKGTFLEILGTMIQFW